MPLEAPEDSETEITPMSAWCEFWLSAKSLKMFAGLFFFLNPTYTISILFVHAGDIFAIKFISQNIKLQRTNK